jgi:iron complex transport system permease protein
MFSKTNRLFLYLFAVVFLVFSIFLGVSIGSVSIPFSVIYHIFLSEIFHVSSNVSIDPTNVSIVMNIRFPRVVLACLVGASLSIAGAGFQGLLKNPLADPYILGVSSGSAVGAVLVLFLGITIPFLGSFTLPVVSIVFGFLTIIFVLTFVRLVNRSLSVETIILTGVIFSSFLGSLISLMIALTGDQLREIIGWLLGSVSMRGWEYSGMMFPFFIVGGLLLIANSSELNALSFGEERAHHLGVNVQVRKMLVLVAASILTGAAVAVSGTIGFVGLVIPHLIRILFGPDHRHLLPLSMLAGGGFLILADLVARTIIAPTELPIGVITALIGAPVFAVLLFRQRMERSG